MSKTIEGEIVVPDVPVKSIRLTVNGEEKVTIPWDEARLIARMVAKNEQDD